AAGVGAPLGVRARTALAPGRGVADRVAAEVDRGDDRGHDLVAAARAEPAVGVVTGRAAVEAAALARPAVTGGLRAARASGERVAEQRHRVAADVGRS